MLAFLEVIQDITGLLEEEKKGSGVFLLDGAGCMA